MTSPDGYTPGEAISDLRAWQEMTQEQALSQAQIRISPSWEDAHGNMGSQIRDPLSGAIVNAGTALTEAQAAANAAANAENKADTAYERATEWALEFVVNSAEVTEGAGEILVGPMIKVRDGRDGLLTDVHFAFLEQHNGITVETRVWNVNGTAYRTVHTAEIPAGVNRRAYPAIDTIVESEERFFPYVVDIVGTIPPTVLQIHLSGVYIDEEE
ncbi:hypothetical protein ABZ413_29525 [Nocardia rhamnosiphila]|uniref:hypothetical protein n=1 Tax=Nocardia rhamnosiphila TaxID=426716 RepID=UPI0033ED29CE